MEIPSDRATITSEWTPPFLSKTTISLISISISMASLVLMRTLLLFLVIIISVDGVIMDGGMEPKELRGVFEVMGSLLYDSNWASLHPHPCTDTPWPGIQCELAQTDPFLHVTKLHIGPDVTSSPPCKASAKLIPPSLLKLPHLKTLSLFSCFLPPQTLTLPPSLFTNTSSLEQLVLISNPGLTGEIPASIAYVKSLRVLSLSQNNFHGKIPPSLGFLPNLRQLDLSYNKLTGEIPIEIGKLSSLTILDLSYNLLSGKISASIGDLRSLQKMDMSTNNLSGTVPPEIGKMDKMVLLDLSHNLITGPIPETLSGMKELEYFLVEDNPIGTSLPLFVGELAKLAVVGFSGCGLLGPIPAYFGSLFNLTALSLDRNKLNGSVPPNLDGLTHLGQLNLSQNQLSGEIGFSSEFVGRLGKRLDVRDNKGLCTRSPHMKMINQSLPSNVMAPPCLGSHVANSSIMSQEPGSGSMDEGKRVQFALHTCWLGLVLVWVLLVWV